MPNYTLPALPYPTSALEPHISRRILELHHGKHHAAYVKNANRLVAELEAARAGDDSSHVGSLEQELTFHVSGHVLHSIFWRNLGPHGGGQPKGNLLAAIVRDFGSFGRFQKQLTHSADSLLGSGWAALYWEPLGRRLQIAQIHDHQSNLFQGGLPLMVLDGWEHAYYLQYENRKDEYFAAVWHLWNWEDIAERFAEATRANVELHLGEASA